MPACWASRDCCSPCPWPLSRSLSTHTSTQDSWTLTHVWLSLLWGHCSFLLGPGTHTLFVFVFFGGWASKSLFPQSCGRSIIKSYWPSMSNSLGVLTVHFLDPQVGKAVVSPWTFTTVQELLCYNCSPVRGSSAWWLYGRVNDDLLQENLCWGHNCLCIEIFK